MQWIPVSERLPNTKDDVLMIRNRNGKQIVRIGDYNGIEWFNALGYTVARDNNAPVTHWCPLPELPTKD